jgi:hypothetical protein
MHNWHPFMSSPAGGQPKQNPISGMRARVEKMGSKEKWEKVLGHLQLFSLCIEGIAYLEQG